MGRPRLVPDRLELQQLLAQGLTHREIAELASARSGHPVRRASVSAAIQREGLAATKPRYTTEIPWRVAAIHQDDYPIRMLRLLGRFRRNPMSLLEQDRKRLENWLRALDAHDLEVAYSRETGCVYLRRSTSRQTATPVRPAPLTPAEVARLRPLALS